MRKCDIIIPIYNAYDFVGKCIYSVLKYTNFDNARLILIDDKSPDERVLPLIEKYQKKNPEKIIVLKNEVNRGFVQTVNIGMKYSGNDVLLLNSDTEVTEGWLDKIRNCALDDEMVATVTPLSNNSTLTSVPKMFTDNRLPQGYDLNKMASLVEKCSMHLHAEVPSANGFCIYIKREALDKVGYFDEENFGKGYGEENDFSFRCLKYGYRNIICDEAYVFHKGAQSFTVKKFHDSELFKKHPGLRYKTDVWIYRQGVSKIGDNIAIELGVQKKRPNLLILTKDFQSGKKQDLGKIVEKWRQSFNCHVLSLENSRFDLRSFFKETDAMTGVYGKGMVVEDVGFYSKEYRSMIERVFKTHKITGVYVEDFLGHNFDFIDICKKKKVKYIVLNRKYYKRGFNDREVDLESWRMACGRLLDDADGIVDKDGLSISRLKKICGKNESEALNSKDLREGMLQYYLVKNTIDDVVYEKEMALKRETELRNNLKKNWAERLKLNPYSKAGKLLRLPETMRRIIEHPEIVKDIGYDDEELRS